MIERRDERRRSMFVEQVSKYLIAVSALGGFVVLLDPSLSGKVLGFDWSIGEGQFSEGLKGAVVNTMMLGGWTAVITYWLRPKEDEKKTEALTRIAEAAPATAAAAVVAAATGTGTGGPQVTPAPMNPETGAIPAAEAVHTNQEMKP